MKSKIALTLIVIAVFVLTASSAGALAPRVWVLDDCDPNWSTPPFDDSLKLLDDAGNIVMRVGGFNACQGSGGWRRVAASPAEPVCWVASAKLDKVDRDGNILNTVGRKFDGVDVDRHGNVYAVPDGTVNGGWLRKIDPSGNVVDSAHYGGADVVVDDEHSLIWLVGWKIALLDTDLQPQFEIDPIVWCAFSVDVASDGTAWTVERVHSQVPGSKDRLLHVSRDGQVLDFINLPFSPYCVRVDQTTGIVWTTGIMGSQGLYKYDPATEQLTKIAGFRGFSLAVDHRNGLIWCATVSDVRAYSMDNGQLIIKNESFGYSQKWITIGPLPVHVDIRPGGCPNALSIGGLSPVIDFGTENTISSSSAKVKPDGPVRRRGVLPLAILGTEDFDVTEIDPSSVTLEGIAPIQWIYEDVSTPVYEPTEECECNELGGDGYTDLTLKFGKLEIIDALGELSAGDEIALTITGELYDGTAILGNDCVIIVGGGPPDGEGGENADEAVAERGGSDRLPSVFALHQNHPNPFNAVTEISFSLPVASDVQLEVYNILGEKVETMVNGKLEAGHHTVSWDSSDAASGIYLYRLTAGEFAETRKMVLMK